MAHLNKQSLSSITFSMPFVRYAYMTVALPLGSLFLCFVTAMIFRYDEVNETVCNVQNFVPSISAITGVFPQAYIWRMCIAAHLAPRLLSCWLYHSLYTTRVGNIEPRRRAVYTRLLRLNFWLHVVENLCLASVTFISNKENYPVHEKIFILFMVSSLCYMILNTQLFKWSSPRPLTDSDKASYKGKMICMTLALTATAALLVAFYLHRFRCVPLAFSFFSIAEYVIAVASMTYHMTAVYDFRDKTISVASLHEDYCNGDVPSSTHGNKSD